MAKYEAKINQALKIRATFKNRYTKQIIDITGGSVSFGYFKPSNQTTEYSGTWSGAVEDGESGIGYYDIPNNVLDELSVLGSPELNWRIDAIVTIDGNTYTADAIEIFVKGLGR